MAKKGIKKTAIFIAVILAVFLPPFIKYQQLRCKNKNLGRQIKSLKEEMKQLEEDKRRLETDITYVEQRAREKIGVLKKGEIVLKEAPARK